MKKTLVILFLLVSFSAFSQKIVDEAFEIYPYADEALTEGLSAYVVMSGTDDDINILMERAVFCETADTLLLKMSRWVTTEQGSRYKKKLSEPVFAMLKTSDDTLLQKKLLGYISLFADSKDIPSIAFFLNDPVLGTEVAHTIVKIPNAQGQVKKLVSRPTNISKSTLAYMVGECELTSMESKLLSWLDYSDDVTKKAIFEALTKMGTEQSLKVMKKEAKRVKYGPSSTGVAEAYSALKNRLETKKEVDEDKPIDTVEMPEKVKMDSLRQRPEYDVTTLVGAMEVDTLSSEERALGFEMLNGGKATADRMVLVKLHDIKAESYVLRFEFNTFFIAVEPNDMELPMIGSWNELEVRVDGGFATISMNGRDLFKKEVEPQLPAGRKAKKIDGVDPTLYRGIYNKNNLFGLFHGDNIMIFRNIRVKKS